MNHNFEDCKLDRSIQQVLGLTNKDVGETNLKTEITKFTEETLVADTLWPEKEKLYYHGNEVIALKVDRRRGIIATSAKARNINEGHIAIWKNCGSYYKVIQVLKSHHLTVVDMAWLETGELVSVGRDRDVRVWEVNEEGVDEVDVKEIANRKDDVCLKCVGKKAQ